MDQLLRLQRRADFIEPLIPFRRAHLEFGFFLFIELDRQDASDVYR